MNRLLAALDYHPLLGHLDAVLSRLPIVGRAWRRLRRNPREMKRYIKFALVGSLGAVVDFTILNVMKFAFEWVNLGTGWSVKMSAHQIQLAAANAISFSAAVLSNFTWNRLWTFPESREKRVGGQLAQFALVNIAGLGINTLLVLAMDQYVFQHLVGVRLSYNLAKAVAIGVVLFWNFGVNRLWTYRGIK